MQFGDSNKTKFGYDHLTSYHKSSASPIIMQSIDSNKSIHSHPLRRRPSDLNTERIVDQTKVQPSRSQTNRITERTNSYTKKYHSSRTHDINVHPHKHPQKLHSQTPKMSALNRTQRYRESARPGPGHIRTTPPPELAMKIDSGHACYLPSERGGKNSDLDFMHERQYYRHSNRHKQPLLRDLPSDGRRRAVRFAPETIYYSKEMDAKKNSGRGSCTLGQGPHPIRSCSRSGSVPQQQQQYQQQQHYHQQGPRPTRSLSHPGPSPQQHQQQQHKDIWDTDSIGRGNRASVQHRHLSRPPNSGSAPQQKQRPAQNQSGRQLHHGTSNRGKPPPQTHTNKLIPSKNERQLLSNKPITLTQPAPQKVSKVLLDKSGGGIFGRKKQGKQLTSRIGEVEMHLAAASAAFAAMK